MSPLLSLHSPVPPVIASLLLTTYIPPSILSLPFLALDKPSQMSSPGLPSQQSQPASRLRSSLSLHCDASYHFTSGNIPSLI
ncbi:hypothetical protein E2C01_039237 [Portunus trituberculatus]|uniref:Uncharacterized protein n=1 Tax=Portunus trituberculatus TaxID=210409 RepID=A0A5B7FJ52_PORTR|nr:hypothetical protein [Portunus trituberculatus]